MTPQIDSTYNNHDYYNHGYYMFVDRQSEFERLSRLIGCRRHEAGQLLLVYCPRRVRKSALLDRWGQQSKLRYIHWSVQQAPANLQRQSLFFLILIVRAENAPTFTSWEGFWDATIDPLNGEWRNPNNCKEISSRPIMKTMHQEKNAGRSKTRHPAVAYAK